MPNSRPSAQQLSCTVVVCTNKRAAQLQKCLSGISDQTLKPIEVLVIDNSPVGNAETEQTAMRWGAKYIVEPRLGLSRARNRGAREAMGVVVAYIDDDAVPDRTWLEKLVVTFHDPGVMAASGRTVLPVADDQVLGLCALIQGDGAVHDPLLLDNSHPKWFEIAAFGGFTSGTNMAFRRSIFDSWPGFDSRLGLPDAAGEEQYAVFSLVDRGFRAAYTPDAIVSHPTTYTLEGLRKRYLSACAYSTEYIIFLFANAPHHRRNLLKFLWEGIFGIRHKWTSPVKALPVETGIHPIRTFLARCRGLLLYLHTRSRGNVK